MNADKKDIADIINEVHKKNDDNDNSNELENYKALELAKIIVSKFLDLTHVESLTFVNPQQIDDIVQARLLNTYYKIPEIEDYITNFETLKRSENGKLVNIIGRLGINNLDNEYNNKNIFDRILKR